MASLDLGLYLASLYSGQQFSEIDWDGGLAIPSGSQYADPDTSFLVAELMNAGVMDPNAPYVSIQTDAEAGTGKVVFGAHLYQWQMEMLGLSHGFFGEVDESGVAFEVMGDLIPGLNFDLTGVINGSQGLDVKGKVTIGVGKVDLGPLGSVNIGTDAQGDMKIYVNGSSMGAGADVTFEFMSETHSLAHLVLDITIASLKSLAQLVWDKIKEWFEDFYKDAKVWAKAVADGIVEGVDDVVKVLQGPPFNEVAAEAQKIWDGATGVAKKCAQRTAAYAL